MRASRKLNPGQTLVEFALLLPILILIILIILDLGRAAYYLSAVYNAAREGSRYGSINPHNDAQICGRAQNTGVLLDLVCPDDVNINLIDNPSIDYIEVTVNYQFKPATPLIGELIPIDARCTGGPCIVISSTSRMQIEGNLN